MFSCLSMRCSQLLDLEKILRKISILLSYYSVDTSRYGKDMYLNVNHTLLKDCNFLNQYILYYCAPLNLGIRT